MLDLAARVALWDAVLAAVRGHFRREGLREVMTPPRVDAVAIEPWIEPAPAPPGWLHTSPELAMKQLVARGAGPIFQITYVARAGEHGAWHHEQFVLLEWYREDANVPRTIADVERVVEHVVIAAAPWARTAIDPPQTWTSVAFLDAVHETSGLVLRGDESAETLRSAITGTRFAIEPPRSSSPRARQLEAWTAFFSTWSDAALDPWLGQRAAAGEGIHLLDFPAPLAALAAHASDPSGRSVSGRFESHAFGRELANGYRELRDPDEQRARFAQVAEIRSVHGLLPLPVPESFLATLADPGLPPCCGAALGLDRLIARAVGADSLAAIALAP